jgi:hypothetical protein
MFDSYLLSSRKPYQNQTARVIKPQLTARITRLKNMIDAGVIEQETQSSGSSTLHVSFYFAK